MTTTVALIGLHFLSYSDTFNVNIQRLMPVKGQKIPGLRGETGNMGQRVIWDNAEKQLQSETRV